MRGTLLVVLAAACAHAQQTANPPPLPPDQGSAADEDGSGSGSAVAAVTPPPKPEPPQPPPKVPHDAALPAPVPTLKLVSAGAGKKTKLVIAGVAGAKQGVDVAIDFGARQGSADQTLPAIVLHGDLEVLAAGAANTYKLTAAQVEAKDVPNETRPPQFDQAVAALAGLVITGDVAANGTPGAIKIHHDAADLNTSGIIEAVIAPGFLSPWPVLPDQPIGPGAKWTVTTPRKFRDRLEYIETTDYELVSAGKGGMEIKAASKLAGPEQELDGAKVTAVSGSGTYHVTMTNGLLGTSHADIKLGFTASAPQGPGANETLTFEFRFSSDITPR